MKKFISLLIALLLCAALLIPASAAGTTCTVQKGDSLWKIAVRYQVGISELIAANRQIENPALIYPGEEIAIPQKDATVSEYEAEVVRLVNVERAKYGLSALTENWELSRVARYKSQDMSDKHYFSHTSPTYGSPYQMMTAFGISYRYAGENIAYGQRTPQQVVAAWLNSSGHRANILSANFKQIGVGYVASGNYWTQMFIG